MSENRAMCYNLVFFLGGANRNMCDMYLECYWKP